MSKFSRRQFLLASMGALAAGCASHAPLPTTDIRPIRTARPPLPPAPQPHAALASEAPAQVVAAGAPVQVIPRSVWARGNAVPNRMNPLRWVDRITVHHSGYHDILFTDYERTRTAIEEIRHVHVRDRQWGDIGYHFIIDRAGRVWQGRPVQYQGAHVKNNNENNIGVLVLGNFERHTAAETQLGALRQMLMYLQRENRVQVRRVFTHLELNPTKCPGRHLQPWMDWARANGHLA